MRLIDAHILMEELQKGTANAIKPDFQKGLLEAQRIVINSPTVDITEEQAIDKLHETGWLPRHDKEMTKRPTGKWIKIAIDGRLYSKCSNCKQHNGWGDVSYCPWCGAKMQEAEKDIVRNEEEKLVEKIIEKIDYVLGGINQISTRQADLLSAQAVRELSEAYKNLAGGRE